MQTVLGSWKEIASYLGKGVRTVQRWERYSGLPVHRPSGSNKGVVIAFPAELEQWARRQDGAGVTSARLTLERSAVLRAQLKNNTQQLVDSTRELMAHTNAFMEKARRRRVQADEDQDGQPPTSQ